MSAVNVRVCMLKTDFDALMFEVLTVVVVWSKRIRHPKFPSLSFFKMEHVIWSQFLTPFIHIICCAIFLSYEQENVLMSWLCPWPESVSKYRGKGGKGVHVYCPCFCLRLPFSTRRAHVGKLLHSRVKPAEGVEDSHSRPTHMLLSLTHRTANFQIHHGSVEVSWALDLL